MLKVSSFLKSTELESSSMKIYLILIVKIVSNWSLSNETFHRTEIQQMQMLTAIFLDIASQLSTIFLQKNGIMLLKCQSLYQKQMAIWNSTVY